MALKLPPDLSIIKTLKMTPNEIFSFFENLPGAVRAPTFLYVPGDTRMPLLVAHVDTVFPKPPTKIIFDKKKMALKAPEEGLGADDRAGVWGIYVLWFNLIPKPGLLLCDLEESGGRGAYDATEAIGKDLKAYPYFLEIDRRGHGEVVFYNDEGRDFRDHVKSFGFKQEWGLFSDVSVLGAECKKCSCNLSAGYYWNHTKGEYLMLGSLENTLVRAKRMVLRSLHNGHNTVWKLPKRRQRWVHTYDEDYWRDDPYRPYYSDWGSTYRSAFDYKAEDKQKRIRSRNTPDFDTHPSGYSRGSQRYKPESVCDCCGMYGPTTYTNLTFGYICASCEIELESALPPRTKILTP